MEWKEIATPLKSGKIILMLLFVSRQLVLLMTTFVDVPAVIDLPCKVFIIV